MGWRNHLIGAGFGLLGTTGLHRLAAPLTRGIGAILTLHHVRPDNHRAFAPNKLLEITPEFLDRTIRHLRQQDYDIITLDEMAARLSGGPIGFRPFAVLTFDDGFRDNLEYALPILERHGAPATFFVATGFPDRTARIWWVELEAAVRKADRITLTLGGEVLDLPAHTPPQKLAAFATLYWRLRRGTEETLLGVIGDLCRAQGIDTTTLIEDLCLDWDELARLAAHPLVTIGAHTMTHAMLAKHDDDRVRAELAGGKAGLERRLGRPVSHLAYPVGDATSACRREFRLAAEAGYVTAVTTRPGLIFPAHRDRLLSLPRVSVNGHHQTVRDLDVLLSGAALTIWNKGRRIAPI